MIVELSSELEAAVQQKAQQLGLAPEDYVQALVEYGVRVSSLRKSIFGAWSKDGLALSAEQIEENRREMLPGAVFEQAKA